MMGMSVLVDWRKDAADAAPYFLKSWSIQPNPTAALILAQIEDRGRGSDSNEKSARWALRAMEFPGASFTALYFFERAVNSEPELAKLETPKVRKLRAHRQRWLEYVKGQTKPFPQAAVGLDERDRKLPADEGRAFELIESEVVARDRDGRELWRRKVEEPEVKLAATGPRVFVISPDRVEVWNATDGEFLYKWPSLVKTDLPSKYPSVRSEGNIEWDAWKYPDGLLGADDENFWFAQESWFCVLRQKDAGGWAHYWVYWIQAIPSEDEAMYICVYGRFIVAVDKKTGKDIWAYGTPWHGTFSILDVNDREIVIYSPQTEKILGLSRKTGKVQWSKTHGEFWKE